MTAQDAERNPVNTYLKAFTERWIQVFSQQRPEHLDVILKDAAGNHYEALKQIGALPHRMDTPSSLHEVLVIRADGSSFTVPTFYLRHDKRTFRYDVLYPFVLLYIPDTSEAPLPYTVPLLAVNLGEANSHPLSVVFYKYAEKYDAMRRREFLEPWFEPFQQNVSHGKNKTLPSTVATVEEMAHDILDASQGFFAFFMPFLPKKDGRYIPGDRVVREVLGGRPTSIFNTYKQRKAQHGVIDIQFRKTWETVSESVYPNALYNHRVAAYGYCYGVIAQQMCQMNVFTSHAKVYMRAMFGCFLSYLFVALGSISTEISKSDTERLSRVYGKRNLALEQTLASSQLVGHHLVELAALKSDISARIRSIGMQIPRSCNVPRSLRDVLEKSNLNFDGERIIGVVEAMCRERMVEPRVVNAIGELVHSLPYHVHHFVR